MEELTTSQRLVIAYQNLEEKQIIFCETYAATRSNIKATRAARICRTTGYKWLDLPWVSGTIALLLASDQTETKITKKSWLYDLQLITQANMADYWVSELIAYQQDPKNPDGEPLPIYKQRLKNQDELTPVEAAAIQAINYEQQTIKLYDKPKALDSIGRAMAFDTYTDEETAIPITSVSFSVREPAQIPSAVETSAEEIPTPLTDRIVAPPQVIKPEPEPGNKATEYLIRDL